jgi:hypothetical protein
MGNNKVRIGIGCQDTVKARTFASIIGLMLVSGPDIDGYSMRQGGDIVSARTFCAKEAIEKKSTHIFFIDSDMEFPPNTLKRLLAHDKDIITVEYNRRKLPPESVTQPLEEKSETELYKARVIGAGCLLIKTSVFEKVAKPWFNFGRNSVGEVVIGEDTWFANSARDAGFDVWIDPQLKVGHCGEYIY